MMRRFLILGVVVLVAASVAACGRKGNPEEPEDAVYPRIYPYTPMPDNAGAKRDPQKKAPAASPYQPPQPRLPSPPSELQPPAAEPGQKP